MPFDTLIDQITAVSLQVIHLTPFLMGVYVAWHLLTSRRGAPVVARVR